MKPEAYNPIPAWCTLYPETWFYLPCREERLTWSVESHLKLPVSEQLVRAMATSRGLMPLSLVLGVPPPEPTKGAAKAAPPRK